MTKKRRAGCAWRRDGAPCKGEHGAADGGLLACGRLAPCGLYTSRELQRGAKGLAPPRTHQKGKAAARDGDMVPHSMTHRTVLLSPAAAARFRELAADYRYTAELDAGNWPDLAADYLAKAEALERAAADRRLELRAVT